MGKDLQELFKSMGVDIEDPSLYESDESMISNASVESGNNRVRKLKWDFGSNFHVLLPTWLELPFNIYTLEPLPKGKAMRSYKMGKTPAALLRVIATIAEQDEDYRKKLYEVLDIDNFLTDRRKKSPEEIKNFRFSVEEDGSCSPLMGELISKFFNFYMYEDVVQRYSLGPERKIQRKALINLKPSGLPDFDNAPDALVQAYSSESSLLYTELQKTEENAKAANQTKKLIDQIKSAVRSQRIVSPPTKAAFVFCFTFPINTSGEFSEADATRFSAPSYKLDYAQTYFRMLSKDIADFTAKAKVSKITNANYVELTRCYPVANDETKDNKGLCAQAVHHQQVISGCSIVNKIPNVNMQMEEFLADPERTDPDEIRKFISEFEPISLDEVLSAYSNNITQYALSLADPTIVAKNKTFLRACESGTGLSLVKEMSESNQVSIDIEAAPVIDEAIEKAVNQEEYFESDEMDTSSVSAAAFIEDEA